MSVHVTPLLREGIDRTTKRNGLVLVGLVFVLSALSSLLGAGVARYVGTEGFVTPDGAANALVAVPPLVAGLLSLVIGLATLVVSIAAVRVFVSDETERLPREHFTRRMGWAALNFIVGAVVFGIVVGLGFVALVVPGVFLLVTLAFWSVYVAVEDQSFLDGFRSSWGLTKGHRLSLLLLGIAVVLVSVVVNAVFGLGFVAGALVGGLVAAVGSAVVTVFSTAVLAAAYNELTALRTEDAPDVEAESVPSTGRERVA